MTAATALMILEIVGSLLGAAQEVPGVIVEAKSLLEKVRPCANELGVDVATEFVAMEQRLAEVKA